MVNEFNQLFMSLISMWNDSLADFTCHSVITKISSLSTGGLTKKIINRYSLGLTMNIFLDLVNECPGHSLNIPNLAIIILKSQLLQFLMHSIYNFL